MLRITYGVPTVAFEAAPDALPASRLGLRIPPCVNPARLGKRTGAYHFGHTADPVYIKPAMEPRFRVHMLVMRSKALVILGKGVFTILELSMGPESSY